MKPPTFSVGMVTRLHVFGGEIVALYGGGHIAHHVTGFAIRLLMNFVCRVHLSFSNGHASFYEICPYKYN